MILSSSHRPEATRASAALQLVEIRKPAHQQPSTQCKDATQLSSLCSQFLLSKRWLCGLFLPASFERRFISEMRNASVAPVVCYLRWGSRHLVGGNPYPSLGRIRGFQLVEVPKRFIAALPGLFVLKSLVNMCQKELLHTQSALQDLLCKIPIEHNHTENMPAGGSNRQDAQTGIPMRRCCSFRSLISNWANTKIELTVDVQAYAS